MSIKTIFKQFKYLINSSFALVDEFGLKYFLNFGISQLKNQKLDLFKYDDSVEIIDNKPKINQKEQYALWKNKIKNICSIDQEHLFPTLNFSPPVHILLIIDNDTSKHLIKSCINSIINQNYSYWNLSIFTNNSEIFNFIEKSIKTNFKNKISVNLIKNNESSSIISNSHLLEEYVLFLTSKIILEKTALYYIVKSLNHNSFDMVYFDEEKFDSKTREFQPFFKPDFSSYLLLNFNYIGNSFLISKKILDKIKTVNGLMDGDFFDLLHQSSELSDKIHHIPLVLFQDGISGNSTLDSHNEIISNVLKRKEIDGTTEISSQSNSIKINFSLPNEPKVSIIIPTKDNKDLLTKCLRGLEYNTSYTNFEIIIIDNNSQNDETKLYLSSLPYQVIHYNSQFNFSEINNLAASQSSGDYLLFLNDDTESISPNWLTEMVRVCVQQDVGVVGAKLLYDNNTIQHAGMVFLKTGYFFHPFQNKPSNSNYFFDFINSIREVSSVTGACLLIKRNLFEEVGKFDKLFDVYYGDSDLCFKVRKYGYKVIYNPHAVLQHESSSKIRKMSKIFVPVENYIDFEKRWSALIQKGDPYYNPNLSLDYNIDYE